jgi:taurine dioxygenase
VIVLRPLGGALGAEVHGIVLRGDLDDALVRELRQLLLEHLVLSFPGQFLSPDEHRAFARRFGALESHTEIASVLEGTDREVVVVAPEHGVSSVWHFDYDADLVPSALGSLNAIECPERGGDTIFSNTYRVYEQLSEPMRELLEGLTAIHYNIGNTGRNREVAAHPLVGIHPETGRKVLIFSGHHVKRFAELSAAESEVLIEHLNALSTRPEVTTRLSWHPGTLCLWDNRCTQHYAVSDFDERRVLHRVTMRSELPRSASTPRWPSRPDALQWHPAAAGGYR